MYSSLTVKVVEEPTTLREFIATLGKDALHAYDRRVVGVIVNDRRLWDSEAQARGQGHRLPHHRGWMSRG